MSVDEQFGIFLAATCGWDQELSNTPEKTQEIIDFINYQGYMDVDEYNAKNIKALARTRMPREYKAAEERRINNLVSGWASNGKVRQEFANDLTNWKSLSIDEKLACMQRWGDRITGMYGIDPLSAVYTPGANSAGEIFTRKGVQPVIDYNFEAPFNTGRGYIKNLDGNIHLNDPALLEQYENIRGEIEQGADFKGALKIMLHETKHAYDAQIADKVFSVLNTEHYSQAEREHAMRIMMNNLRYQKSGRGKYEGQYAELSTHYSELYFMEQLDKQFAN